MADTFILFPNLPKELRLQIWEHTLQPRALTLHCATDRSAGAIEPFLLKLFVSSPRRTIFPLNKQDAVDELVRLSPSNIPPLGALAACEESRSVALSRGYRAWRMDNKAGEVLDVMWHPDIDIVCFSGPHLRLLPQLYTEIFYLQFPHEATEVRKIAIPSSHWRESWGERLDRIEHWLKFGSLREIILVVDKAFETKIVRRLEEHQQPNEGGGPWFVPGNIEEALEKAKLMKPGIDWQVPSVRVVRDEASVLKVHDLELALRCYPCEDLGINA